MPLLTYTTASLAAGMLSLSASRLAAAGWRTARLQTRSLRLRTADQRRLRRETEHVRLASELKWQTGASPNVAWRVMEVIDIADESDDCRSFYLRDASGQQLPVFQPGQFVAVRPALGGYRQPTRCYSLSDAPSQPWWRITVKRIDAASSDPDPQPSGLSLWLHQRMRIGDCLLVHGPSGHFTVDVSSTTPVALLAAGIGITPLISMLKHTLETQPARQVSVFFQASDEMHWPFGHALHDWQGACPSLNVSTYFSRASSAPEVEYGQIELGKFSVQRLLAALPHPHQTQFYVCGPQSWMTDIESELIASGIRKHQLRSESFGNARLDTEAGQVAAVEPWSLTFSNKCLRIPTSVEPKTIWQAAKEQGLEIPAACHTGACGTCRLKLRSGSVRYRAEPVGARAPDEVLACVAQPVGDVVVEAT